MYKIVFTLKVEMRFCLQGVKRKRLAKMAGDCRSFDWGDLGELFLERSPSPEYGMSQIRRCQGIGN
jgi:hypothetical protein